MVKRLEDGGSAAIVLPSIFEEQVTIAESGRIHSMDPLDSEFALLLSEFALNDQLLRGPNQYLEHIRLAKRAVRIPVIASLNGITGGSWLKYAFEVEQAGADAIELNLDEAAIDPRDSSLAVEARIRNAVAELKRELRIPLAIKLTPYFTAFANLAHQLDDAGANGLVLFHRFSHPDLELDGLKLVTRHTLSQSPELLLRLHWVAVLRSHVAASLAITGGVATATDGIKALLVGADAVQMTSAIFRNGPHCFDVMSQGLSRWAEEKGFRSIDDLRGRMSLQHTAEPTLYERANYIRTLQTPPPKET
jgi:dihydroorotate dehydrogenase (fumarate)